MSYIVRYRSVHEHKYHSIKRVKDFNLAKEFADQRSLPEQHRLPAYVVEEGSTTAKYGNALFWREVL